MAQLIKNIIINALVIFSLIEQLKMLNVDKSTAKLGYNKSGSNRNLFAITFNRL